MAKFKNIYQEKSVNGYKVVVDHPDIRTFTTTMFDGNGNVVTTRTYSTLRWAMKRYYSLLAKYGHDLYAAIMQ